MKFNLNSAYTARILNNCARMANENADRKQGRDLYKRALAEEAEMKRRASIAAANAHKYDPSKPYIFPDVKEVLSYHESWGSYDLQEQTSIIVEAMRIYKFKASIAGVNQGPKMIQYIIEPSVNSSITNMLKKERNFQSLLHCNCSMRFDNGYVYLEVPSDANSEIDLGDMLLDEEFQNSDKFTMSVGMGVDGSKHFVNIEDAYHILISGMTGSGKSIVLQNMILSLLMKHNPSEMHINIIDPKESEFSYYRALDACSVVNNIYDAPNMLESLCTEMDKRYRTFALNGCRDIESFNKKFPHYTMRREFLFIDELSDLMYTCKSAESYIVRLAQKARACGIHLIIATQYPIAKVVTGLIKANMPTKICLRVGTTVNSMVAIDRTGGEKLMGHGDMLFIPNGSLDPVRLQGGFVSEAEITNIVCSLYKNR